MRIALVTETWRPSIDGVVTRLQATCTELVRAGHQVLVVAPAGGEREYRGARVVGVAAVGLPFLAGGKPWGLPTPRVGRLLRQFRPDVVHVVHPFVLGLAGVLAARRLRLPLVASFHQDIADVAHRYHAGWLDPVIWAYTRRLHNLADAYLVTSRAVAATVARHGIGSPVLWPYGVDLELFHPKRRDDRVRATMTGGGRTAVVALYVGRLAPEKDLDRLAPLAHGDGIRLVVVGDGPHRTTLERRLRGSSVTFLGSLTGDTLADVYAAADVFVFPSTTETLGLVLLESLASGLPVVALDTGTSREILAGVAGSRLCPVGDLDLFVATVREAGRPGADWQRRSAGARRAAELWSWAAATDTLLTVYEAVIDAVRHRRERRR